MPTFWGQLTTRVLDVATGRELRVHRGENVVVYMTPLILMDLLAQTAFDSLLDAPEQAILNIDAQHPLDAGRGFAAAVDVVGDPQSNAVRYIRVGTSSTATDKTDTGLVSTVSGLDGMARITDITLPTNNSIKFVAMLEGSQGNGSTLQEAALVTRGDTVTPVTDPSTGSDIRTLCRRVHAAEVKDVTVQLEYSWTLSFE